VGSAARGAHPLLAADSADAALHHQEGEQPRAAGLVVGRGLHGHVGVKGTHPWHVGMFPTTMQASHVKPSNSQLLVGV
jgi:hypothetical protein